MHPPSEHSSLPRAVNIQVIDDTIYAENGEELSLSLGPPQEARDTRATRARLEASSRQRLRIIIQRLTRSEDKSDEFIIVMKDIKMLYHQECMQKKRQQIRIRELELQTQKEWQNVANKALDLFSQLITKP